MIGTDYLAQNGELLRVKTTWKKKKVQAMETQWENQDSPRVLWGDRWAIRKPGVQDRTNSGTPGLEVSYHLIMVRESSRQAC